MSNINLVNAQQAKAIYNYKNTKGKIYRTHAATCSMLFLCSFVLIDFLIMVLRCRNMYQLIPRTIFYYLYCILLSAFFGQYTEYKKMHRLVTLNSRKIRCIWHSPDLSVAVDIQITNQCNRVSVSCVDRFIPCCRLRETRFLFFVTFAQ